MLFTWEKGFGVDVANARPHRASIRVAARAPDGLMLVSIAPLLGHQVLIRSSILLVAPRSGSCRRTFIRDYSTVSQKERAAVFKLSATGGVAAEHHHQEPENGQLRSRSKLEGVAESSHRMGRQH